MPLLTGIPNIINDTQAHILRAVGTHQTDNGLLAVPPYYTHSLPNGSGGISSYKQRQGIRFLRFEMLNAAAAAAGGIGFRFDSTYLKVGRLSEDGATLTDITAEVKARTEVAVQVVGADQTGFVVGYPIPFGWMSADFTTAETDNDGGVENDHAVYFSDTIGTAWTVTTAGSAYKDDYTKTNAVWAAEAKNFVWAPPASWSPNVSLMGGEWKGLYLMRFTTAQKEALDVAAMITGLEVGILEKVTSIAQNGIYENELSSFHSRYADGVVAFFATAAAGNRVYAEWETV